MKSILRGPVSQKSLFSVKSTVHVFESEKAVERKNMMLVRNTVSFVFHHLVPNMRNVHSYL